MIGLLFASSLIIASTGGTYMFPLYSNLIKNELGLTQTQTNILSTFKDVGNSLGIFTLFIPKILPTWLIIIIGAVINCTGYLLLLNVVSKNTHYKVLKMSIIFLITPLSKAIMKTTLYNSIVITSPQTPQPLLSLISCLVPLGGAALTITFQSFFPYTLNSSLLFLGFFPSLITILPFALYFRFSPKNQNFLRNKKVGNFFLCTTAFVALIFLVLTATQQLVNTSTLNIFSRITSICVWGLPTVLAFTLHFKAYKHEDKVTSAEQQETQVTTDTLSNQNPSLAQQTPKTETLTNQNPSIFICLRSYQYWLIALPTWIGVGSTISTLDQIGQISESFSINPTFIHILIQYAMVLSFFGRIVIKFCSELITSKNISNFFLPMLISISLTLTHVSFAFPLYSGHSLFLSTILTGLCHGGQLQVAAILLSERFCPVLQKLHLITKLAVPIFTFFYKIVIISPQYEIHAASSESTGNSCLGVGCFRSSFILMAGLGVIQIIWWSVMFRCDQKRKEVSQKCKSSKEETSSQEK